MSLLQETKSLLWGHHITPKKSRGQNFMINAFIFQTIIDYAGLGANDHVLDIGAGLGFLTQLLAKACESVLAVEVDPQLVSVLHERLKETPNVKIIEGDVLHSSVPCFSKVVSIPPYQVSSNLLLWLFDKPFTCAVLIFQKEFAHRLTASVGSENYGWLTVLAHCRAEVELLDDVPKSMFYPQPKVDSIIVRIKHGDPKRKPVHNERLFRQLLRSCFTMRNRKVRKAVLTYAKGHSDYVGSEEDAKKIAESLPFAEKRIRELTPEDFGVLADALLN